MSDLRRNHWGIGLTDASQNRSSDVLQLCRGLLTGSGGKPWRECAWCGRSFGKATHAIERNEHDIFVHSVEKATSTEGRDIPSLSVSFAGAAAVGGKGRKNKVSDGKGSVQF